MTIYQVVMAIYNNTIAPQSSIMIQCTEQSILGVRLGNFVVLSLSDERLAQIYDIQIKGLFASNNGVAIEI